MLKAFKKWSSKVLVLALKLFIKENSIYQIFFGLLKKNKRTIYIKDAMGIFTNVFYPDEFLFYLHNNVTSDAAPLLSYLEKKINKMKFSLDIGANVGITTIWMAKRSLCTYAFEPEEENYLRCMENLSVNHINNVRLFKQAVSNKGGETTLHVLEGYGHHSLGKVGTSPERETRVVKVVTLDDFCKENSVDFIDLLKIDVEGFEYEVLKGATGLITSKRIKMIAFEVSSKPLHDLGKKVDELSFLLKNSGYNIFNLSDKEVTVEDLRKVFHGDFIAIPNQ